jgi:hypothetical protein
MSYSDRSLAVALSQLVVHQSGQDGFTVGAVVSAAVDEPARPRR